MTRAHYRDAINALNILSDLADFDPHVAGTLPLGLQTNGSDIDILCSSDDLDSLTERVWSLYAAESGFRMWRWASAGRPVVASFEAHGWEFEIFGSTEPVEHQQGWRHFEVERRLLLLAGEPLRSRVMKLRQAGFKTEPAFWSALNRSGSAYCGMLSFHNFSDDHLAEILREAGFAK
jgi:hypothetical protein